MTKTDIFAALVETWAHQYGVKVNGLHIVEGSESNIEKKIDAVGANGIPA